MQNRNRLVISLATLIIIIGIIAVGLAVNAAGETVEAEPVVEMTAPHPITPDDNLTFVESDLTLSWDWAGGLAENQAYVVRLWFEEQTPREAWVGESSFDAQEFIDSFSADWGTYQWQVAVVNTSENGFEGMGSEWSEIQTLNRVRRISPEPYPEELMSDAARMIAAENYETATETIDAVRDFVYLNAVDRQQRPYEADYSDAIQIMYDYSQGLTDEQPYLQCDGRSGSMFTLLQELGIESRLILLYGHDSSWISQHTFLEVFNPDTQQWEVHDGLYGIYLYDEVAERRASAERAIFGPVEGMTACNTDGECSLDFYDNVDGYLKAFRYGYTMTIWVNPDRFDLSKRFQRDANLAEFLTGDPLDVTLQIGRWQGY